MYFYNCRIILYPKKSFTPKNILIISQCLFYNSYIYLWHLTSSLLYIVMMITQSSWFEYEKMIKDKDWHYCLIEPGELILCALCNNSKLFLILIMINTQIDESIPLIVCVRWCLKVVIHFYCTKIFYTHLDLNLTCPTS